jgi:hypothetical protein
MGMYELGGDNQTPFIEGLESLRNHLSCPRRRVTYARRGLRDISVLAGNPSKHILFRNNPYFQKWLSGHQDHIGTRRVSRRRNLFRRFDMEVRKNPAAAQSTLEKLNLLSEFLANETKLRELARIGPCGFLLGWDREQDPLDPSILIENWVPGCYPNSDWSISRSKGLHFHS